MNSRNKINCGDVWSAKESSMLMCQAFSTLYSLLDRAIRSPFLERSCGFNGCLCSFKLPQYWFNSYWPPILTNFMRLPSFFMMALASHKCNFLILNQILNAILPNPNFVTLRNFSISEPLIKKINKLDKIIKTCWTLYSTAKKQTRSSQRQ